MIAPLYCLGLFVFWSLSHALWPVLWPALAEAFIRLLLKLLCAQQLVLLCLLPAHRENLRRRSLHPQEMMR